MTENIIFEWDLLPVKWFPDLPRMPCQKYTKNEPTFYLDRKRWLIYEKDGDKFICSYPYIPSTFLWPIHPNCKSRIVNITL